MLQNRVIDYKRKKKGNIRKVWSSCTPVRPGLDQENNQAVTHRPSFLGHALMYFLVQIGIDAMIVTDGLREPFLFHSVLTTILRRARCCSYSRLTRGFERIEGTCPRSGLGP